MRNPDLVQYLLRDTELDPATGCLLWTGKIESTGYGRMYNYLGRGPMRAHRALFFAAYGEVPRHVYVCHKCDVRRCVNPDHLFPSSHAGNMADMKRKGRASKACLPNRGEGNANATITADIVREVRRRIARGERQVDVGRAVGITPAHVSLVHRRVIWGHVE